MRFLLHSRSSLQMPDNVDVVTSLLVTILQEVRSVSTLRCGGSSPVQAPRASPAEHMLGMLSFHGQVVTPCPLPPPVIKPHTMHTRMHTHTRTHARWVVASRQSRKATTSAHMTWSLLLLHWIPLAISSPGFPLQSEMIMVTQPTHVCVCVSVCVSVFVCLCLCTRACTCVCMCVCVLISCGTCALSAFCTVVFYRKTWWVSCGIMP